MGEIFVKNDEKITKLEAPETNWGGPLTNTINQYIVLKSLPPYEIFYRGVLASCKSSSKIQHMI